jgi:outer membrane receptor protein involved in Fe transport
VSLITLLALCGPALAAGTVEGVVLDAETGAPREGATIALVGASAETRVLADGSFELSAPAGTWVVHVRPPGGGPIEAGSVLVVDDRVTELLVSLPERGAPVVGIEQPAASAAAPAEDAVVAEVRGRVLDEGGRPLAGARVYARGQAAEAVTDGSGAFALPLPVGVHDLSFLRSGYATRTVSEVAVTAEGAAPVEVTLVEAGLSLAAFEVTAPRVEGSTAGLLQERRDSASVSDTIGAEQMTKAGATDAASALARVTGITVVGGRYVYVRGLGDRYSATLLNGSTLPSPEPEKRVVPLDLFPTSVLEGVVIQKTFSPDRPAEFGGGVVQIRTRSVPDEQVFQLGVSAGYQHGDTFTSAPSGPRGPTDWLGFGSRWRALPEVVEAQAADQSIKPSGIFSDEGFDAEEIERFGEAFPNRWDVADVEIPMDLSGNVAWGDSWDLGGPRLGVLVGGNWANRWDQQDAVRNVYSATGGEIVLKRRTEYEQLQNRITLGGILGFGLSWDDASEIVSTLLVNRVSEYEALTYFADDPTGSADSRSTRTGWVEQQLVFQQLTGHHPMFGERLAFDWRYAYSQADRTEPDRREHTYLKTQNGYFLSQKGTWNEILYATLQDRNHDAGADLTLEVLREAERPGSIKVGGLAVERSRESTSRRYSYEFNGSDGLDLSAPIGEVLTPDNIGASEDGDPGFLELKEVTANSDDYTAVQHLRAVYGMTELPVGARLRVMGGARVEHSEQVVQTFELFNPSQVPIDAALSTTDVLPAATATLAVGPEAERDRMLVRVGYGRTLSRPEFRELSEVPFTDFKSGSLVYGEPSLERAVIDNVDLRWEVYPSPSESISVAGFYKFFDSPIERITEISAVSGLASTFANAEAATNLGVEVDARVSFGRLHGALEDFFFATNGALIRSRVDLSGSGGNDTSVDRPLQGQSPWVANAQLGYDNPETGLSLMVLYNAFGPRIVDVGQSGIPDTYEMPVHRLDAVAILPIAGPWQLRLRGRNLLDPAIVQRTGTELAEETYDGWSVSAGLQWRP